MSQPHDPQMVARLRDSRRRLARRNWSMYTFIVPGLLFIILFSYVPLLGNVVAFQDYSPYWGIAGSEWVGLDNFRNMLSDPEVLTALRNTLAIAFLQLLFAFPGPIALALLLNSLLSERIKRAIQTIVYLPHFLSWVVVISIWQQIFGGAGLAATLLELAGIEGFNLMANPDTFWGLAVAQGIWKDVGWGTIIFLAAIAGIPTELYESAATDGAGGWRRTWHITLPGLVPVITLLLILNIGGLLTVGFEQFLLQQSAVGADVAQVLDTFVYFRGISGGDWGLSAAAGLLKGIIGTTLIVAANWFAKKLGTDGLF